jgi:glycosyltransferase involved in cell wall biosynthesis
MLDGYHHIFLRNLSRRPGGGFWARINPGIVNAISRGRYDAVLVMGWGSITAWLAFTTCCWRGIPFFINGDNSFVEDRPNFKGWARKYLLRRLFHRTAAFMVMGTMNGDFYRHYGADPSTFFPMPYGIDNERFFNGSRLTPAERIARRRELSIDHDRLVILFSGKLIARKNPLHVLKALEQMRYRDQAAVIFMGDGVERSELQQYVRSRCLDHVYFLGFVNQTRMPAIYGLSDVFVLPACRENWGVVVNEAMACGMPVVVSDQVGASGGGDIVRDGENGFVFRAGDINRLAQIFDTLAADPALRSRMGARSLEIIATWGYELDVKGILSALRATVPLS